MTADLVLEKYPCSRCGRMPGTWFYTPEHWNQHYPEQDIFCDDCLDKFPAWTGVITPVFWYDEQGFDIL